MLTNENRLKSLRRVALFFLLVGIGMSLNLWMNQRLFPLIPIHQDFPILPRPVDMILLGLFGMSVLGNIVIYNRKLLIASLGLLLLILLQDQMRWQPWVYTYSLMLLPFAFLGEEKKSSQTDLWRLRCAQVVLIGIYLWSGINKLNPGFTEVTYPLMLSKLFGLAEGSNLHGAKWLGYLIPITETAVGIGLYFVRTRKIMIWGAIFTHLIIIAYLFSMGENGNPIVIPWNIAMIIFVLLAFFQNNNAIQFREKIDQKKNRKSKTASVKYATPWVFVILLALSWLMPLLRFADKWDNYLSFNLYSDNIEYLYIGVRGEALAEIESNLGDYFAETNLMQEGNTLDVFSWSLGELNVPVYPEERVYKSIARHFCSQSGAADSYMFITYRLPFSADNYEIHRCEDWGR